MAYIYKIVNDINDKIYVGKSSYSLQKRFSEHRSDYLRPRNNKRPLYDAMKKYGIEHFHIELIEEVGTDEKASEREVYWIDKLRTYIGFPDCKGYNATLGGDGKHRYDYSVIAKKYLEIGTIKGTKEFFHCDQGTVRIACKQNGVKIKFRVNKKRIAKISLDGTQEIFDSVTDAAKTILNKPSARQNISKAAKTQGTAYGYKWKIIE